MTVARYVVAGLLVALLGFSASQKLSLKPEVVASYARVGVDRRRLPVLATVLLLGAAGVVAGFIWTPLGIAAASCLTLYFVLALAAHAIHRDMSHAATPALILALAIGAAVLFGMEL